MRKMVRTILISDKKIRMINPNRNDRMLQSAQVLKDSLHVEVTGQDLRAARHF